MRSAEQYRVRAAELRAAAAKEPREDVAAALDTLARCYVRLAEQADCNSLADLWLEVGPKPRLDESDGA
jgi:hypothetical protein